MKSTHINNILGVYKRENKIVKPRKQELAFKLVEQIASLFTAGTFYYYLLNFETLKMDFVHHGTKEVLGFESKNYSLDKLFDIMHPEDLKMMHNKEKLAVKFLLEDIHPEEIPMYKVVYLMRLRHTNGCYKTILHQVQAFNVSYDGKVQQVIGVHTDVTYLNLPFDHNVSFISHQRPSYYSVPTGDSFQSVEDCLKGIFTTREKEIIVKISEGYRFNEIAGLLSISPLTVNTHRKNILKKSDGKNMNELIAKCIREGII